VSEKYPGTGRFRFALLGKGRRPVPGGTKTMQYGKILSGQGRVDVYCARPGTQNGNPGLMYSLSYSRNCIEHLAKVPPLSLTKWRTKCAFAPGFVIGLLLLPELGAQLRPVVMRPIVKGQKSIKVVVHVAGPVKLFVERNKERQHLMTLSADQATNGQLTFDLTKAEGALAESVRTEGLKVGDRVSILIFV